MTLCRERGGLAANDNIDINTSSYNNKSNDRISYHIMMWCDVMWCGYFSSWSVKYNLWLNQTRPDIFPNREKSCTTKYKYYYFIIILSLPTTTLYLFRIGSLAMQWAAVTTQVGVMRDPPHVWPPFFSREICQGQEWGVACSPFITRPVYPIWCGVLSPEARRKDKGFYSEDN